MLSGGSFTFWAFLNWDHNAKRFLESFGVKTQLKGIDKIVIKLSNLIKDGNFDYADSDLQIRPPRTPLVGSSCDKDRICLLKSSSSCTPQEIINHKSIFQIIL